MTNVRERGVNAARFLTRCAFYGALCVVYSACQGRDTDAHLAIAGSVAELPVGVEELWTVGGGSVLFANIGDVVDTPDGYLYVADRGSQRVIKLDADGAVLGSVGSRGGGPGEFSSGPRFIDTYDGVVAAFEGEISGRRVHLFDMELAFIRTIRLENKVKPTMGIAYSNEGALTFGAAAESGCRKRYSLPKTAA